MREPPSKLNYIKPLFKTDNIIKVLNNRIGKLVFGENRLSVCFFLLHDGRE